MKRGSTVYEKQGLLRKQLNPKSVKCQRYMSPPHQPKTLGEEDWSFIAKRYD